MCTGSPLQNIVSDNLKEQLKRCANKILLNIVHTSSAIVSEALSFSNVTTANIIILRGKSFGNEMFYFLLKEKADKIRKRKIYM